MRLRGARGKLFEPVSFVVGDRLSVSNYARGLDISDPVLLNARSARAMGYRGRPVPPPMLAFFQTVTPEALTGELGFTWGRTLGVSMEVDCTGIITEEDEVTGQSSVEEAYERVAGDGVVRQFLRLRTDFRDASGHFACRWWALFIERKEGSLDEEVAGRASTEAGGTGSGAGESAPWVSQPRVRQLVRPGEELPSLATGVINRLTLARMSVAIDNPDPLHLDEAVAHSLGLSGVVGQGSLVAGALYEPVRLWAGMASPLSGSVALSRPYGEGASLRSTGRVTEVIHERDGAVAVCDTTLMDKGGVEIGRGSFRVPLQFQVSTPAEN